MQTAVSLGLATIIGVAYPCVGHSQTPSGHDGQHDFDFNIGVWRTHIRRVVDPFASNSESVELNGTVTVRKVWGGKAELEEIEADGPKGHWEGLTLFLYNPSAHQWSQSFANSKVGILSTNVGVFTDGRVVLVGQDNSVSDKTILVRAMWSDIKPDSHQYEEWYSNDGGVTWVRSFTANLTRLKQTPTRAEPDGQHDFDFEIGTWKVHNSRLLHPLTGDTTWSQFEGASVASKVWDGRADLVELESDSPAGHSEGLILRLYNPQSRQWSATFANSKYGTLSQPAIGEFTNGRGEFYNQDILNGRAILARTVVSDITPTSYRVEFASSGDGGKTWEVNWISVHTRVGG
jgi:hypothetical protein